MIPNDEANVYFPECPVCFARVTQVHLPECPLGRQMSQIEARREARRLQKQGLNAIAESVPRGAWGGTEKYWTVVLVIV
jgi:hypothetical protein